MTVATSKVALLLASSLTNALPKKVPKENYVSPAGKDETQTRLEIDAQREAVGWENIKQVNRYKSISAHSIC